MEDLENLLRQADEGLSSQTFFSGVQFVTIQNIKLILLNVYVANGGWVPRSQGTGTADPNPGRWNTP